MEQLLWRSLQHGQADGLQGYNTQILWYKQARCHPSRCVTKRTRSGTPARWMPCHLCLQGLDPCRTTLCQHRTRNVSLCIRSWTFSHLCLRQIVHDRVWPQAVGTDQSEKPCWCTRKTTENAAMLAELWCKDHLQTWTRDVGSWYLVTVCPSDCPGGSTRPGNPPRPYHTREEESFPTVHPRKSTTSLPGRDHHHRVAWRRHRPAKCTLTLSHTEMFWL